MESQSDRYSALIRRARAGEAILIDGATGSECFRRGVPKHEIGWSGAAALSHPDVVRSIHSDYVALGCDLIVSNTFATGRNIMRDVGVDADFATINRRAVELALEARESSDATSAESCVVGGGISNWSFSGNRPSLAQLRTDTAEQARIMSDAGAEFLSLEMMVDLPRMEATLNAVDSVDLPVWVGISVGPLTGHEADLLGDEIELSEGGLVRDAVALAAQSDAVDAICVMHTDVRLAERSLQAVHEHWDGPLGVYAHAFAEIDGEFTHDDVVSPEEYAAYLPAWQAASATMLGGCCGMGPDHIRLIAEAIR